MDGYGMRYGHPGYWGHDGYHEHGMRYRGYWGYPLFPQESFYVPYGGWGYHHGHHGYHHWW